MLSITGRREVRQGNGLQYSLGSVPCPLEWSSFSCPAWKHWPEIQRDFSCLSTVDKRSVEWLALSKILCGQGNKPWIPWYRSFSSVCIQLHIFLNKDIWRVYYVLNIILVPGLHERAIKKKNFLNTYSGLYNVSQACKAISLMLFLFYLDSLLSLL